MGFLTPALLAGIALVAVPIALHLIMRREPRQYTFPALRFVMERRDSNRRRMQLRHWLLLALRCAVIALLAFALARPTLLATGLHGKEGSPLAVAAVVDNSLRMEYVRGAKSRLADATRLAGELVAKFPEDATVAIVDLSRSVGGFAPDLSAAESRLAHLRPAADARPLHEAIVDAIRLVAAQEDRRPEVFVFTDLAAQAWTDEAKAAINDALADAPDARLYVVDVGVEKPQNAALGPLELRRTVLRPGEPLHIETTVQTNLPGEPPLVELALQNDDGQFVKRGQQIAAAEPGKTSRLTFEIADLPPGAHQGSVRLATSDPLSIDNERFFTIEVRPAAKVLLAAERPQDARAVHYALAPSLPDEPDRFDVTVKTFDELAATPLDEFQAAVLLDPPPLAAEAWNSLGEFAASGGGVAVMLGHNAELAGFNAEVPQRLLPGRLKRISREQTYLRPRRLDHPALAPLARYAEDIPWAACRVFAFWQFDELAADAYVVAGYANDEPAIIERPAGRGRVLTTTTPFSDPLNPEGREPWNVLESVEVAWPFLPLCQELVGYLAQDADERLDCLAGETARIRLAPREQVTNFVLRMPDGAAETRIASTGEPELSIGTTDQLGNYRLSAGGESRTLDRGFSVNAPPEASELARADGETLLAALPADRAFLANDLAGILEHVEIGRAGRELYPWLIGLVALVWGAEHLLANRFYREAKVVAL